MSSLRWHQHLNFLLHSQYHGCWCPGNARSQDIIIHGYWPSSPIIIWSQHQKCGIILHSQYHGCWCPGNARSQGIDNHGHWSSSPMIIWSQCQKCWIMNMRSEKMCITGRPHGTGVMMMSCHEPPCCISPLHMEAPEMWGLAYVSLVLQMSWCQIGTRPSATTLLAQIWASKYWYQWIDCIWFCSPFYVIVPYRATWSSKTWYCIPASLHWLTQNVNLLRPSDAHMRQ